MFWRFVQGIVALAIMLTVVSGTIWTIAFVSTFINGSVYGLFTDIDVLYHAFIVANYAVAGFYLFCLVMYLFNVRVEVDSIQDKGRK